MGSGRRYAATIAMGAKDWGGTGMDGTGMPIDRVSSTEHGTASRCALPSHGGSASCQWMTVASTVSVTGATRRIVPASHA